MRQQINLYQGVLIDKPEPLQSRAALVVLVVVVICLALVGGFDYWRISKQNTYLAQLQQQHEVDSARIMTLETQYPERTPSTLLKDKVVRLEQEVLGHRQALEFFSTQGRKSNQLILSTLDGLARYRHPGVWLQRIALLHGGHEVELVGTAIKPEQVPEYLQLLGDKEIFAGKVFNHLQLSRLDDSAEQVEFTLTSTAEVGE